jgi:ectoine hydroxylase-related dioxygenase (phytanoyl-CoA dioxygenase family)
MPIEHFSPDAPAEKVAEALVRDGCAVVDDATRRETLNRIRVEMAPYEDALPTGLDLFAGESTKRVGGLIPRSKTSHEVIMDPLVLGVVGSVLAHVTNFHLHLTQIIAIGAGETPQPIHRDQWAFDFFPFPKGYEVQCNTLWAMTDFREENGATRVLPGSHLFDDKLEFALEDSECVEMDAGSALMYTGSLYHGGGANQTDATRVGLNITYAVSWLRQEENQYLTTPLEQARELPDDLLRLMGYQRGGYALGYVDDTRDPMQVVRDIGERNEFGDLAGAQARLRDSAR